VLLDCVLDTKLPLITSESIIFLSLCEYMVSMHPLAYESTHMSINTTKAVTVRQHLSRSLSVKPQFSVHETISAVAIAGA
jgi:hypothetical protein